MVIKIYELTDSNYDKYLVRGIKSKSEAITLAKKVFGRYFWKSGIVYYDDTSKKKGYKTTYGTDTMTKSEFLKYKEIYKNKEKILQERQELNWGRNRY